MVRYSFLLFVAFLFNSAAFAQEQQNGAIFSFTETVHDFGKVPLDSPLHYSFEFTNPGNAMLIITQIQPSCHCVTANWTRGPIMPGAKGKVDVTYAAPIDPGRFDRALLIASNAANVDPNSMRYEIRVRGEAVAELPKPVKKMDASRTRRRAHGAK